MNRHTFLKALLAAVLLACIAIPVLVACSGDGAPQDSDQTTSSETDPTETAAQTEEPSPLPPAVTGQLLRDKDSFDLQSGDSMLRLRISGNALFIARAQTMAKKENRIENATQFALPAKYQNGNKYLSFNWTYVGYLNYRPEGSEYHQYGYVFRFRDESVPAQYDLYVTAHYSFAGPFEFTGYLTNERDSALTYCPDDYFSVTTKGESAPTVWTFNKESGSAEGWTLYDGTRYSGTGIYKRKMTIGQKAYAQCTTNQDWNAGGQIPMIYVDHQTYGLYYALEWTNGTIEASSPKGKGECTVSVSLGTNILVSAVPAGETFYMPTVYMGVYEGSVDNGSNVFKRWFLYNKAPSVLLTNENEPLVQQDMQSGLDVSECGIQSVKWDYGWWSHQTAPGQSRWQVNEGLLELDMQSGYAKWLTRTGAKDMAEFAQKVKEKGLTWTVYILLKDTGLDREGVPTSVGQYGHPEWFSNRVVTVGKSADLGNADCVEFYKDYMLNFFKQTGVTTWRSDFEPICRSSDKANRHAANGSDVQYWCSVGFYDLVDYLYENLDTFRYESCCSGGAMKDFSTMRRAVVLNCDDSADFMSLKMSFYDSSYCIHPAQLQLPTNSRTYDTTSKYYTGIGDHLYGLRSQLAGAVMLSNWDGGDMREQVYWKKYVTTYNARIKPLIKYGDMYHIFDRPDGVHWDGFAYIDADAESSTKGIVMLWKPTKKDYSSKVIKLEGLDPNATYSVEFNDRTEQSCKMTGKALMEEGFTAKIEGDFGSEWVWIVET